ncbi:hypothetical protein Bpfe_016692 [Biomphalaria pfeifferi]|uniref:Uncharacterized protein n=1 Tax=Biomphalaria pfeifferi TaxID=112525 RepID=A0AAD8BH92_BIOPF|nr:hypothetical protein Bpfe_016692 [Biomphalaria pfeifferi]
MTSYNSVAFRGVASKDERLFEEEQLPDGSFDEADDELVIVEVEDRKHDAVSDDEEAPLTVPLTAPLTAHLTAPTSKKHGQDKLKSPLSKGNCHQNEKEWSPLLKSSSRIEDNSPLELSPHFENAHVRTPRSTTVTSNLSPRHFSGIDRTASQNGPGSALDPNRSRADNQNKCASVSELPAFHKETGSALSVPNKEPSASSRPLHAPGRLDSNTVKHWPSTGSVDLTGHRNVPDLIKGHGLKQDKIKKSPISPDAAITLIVDFLPKQNPVVMSQNSRSEKYFTQLQIEFTSTDP